MKKYFLISLVFVAGFTIGCSNKWKTYSPEKFGFSIDSPYPMKFKTNNVTRKNGTQLEELNGSKEINSFSFFKSFLEDMLKNRKAGVPDVLSIFVYSTKGRDKECNPGYDPEKMAKSYLEISKKTESKFFKNTEYKIERTSCSGLPATLLLISRDSYDNDKFVCKNYEKYFFVAKTDQYWSVHFSLINFRNDGKNDFDLLTDRMIASIKIEPPKP